MGMRIRSLGPVLLLSLGGTPTACSTSATPVTHHVVEDVGVRGDAAVCDPFNQVASTATTRSCLSIGRSLGSPPTHPTLHSDPWGKS